MMKNILILLCLCYPAILSAQQSAGDYRSGFEKKGNTVYFSNEYADVRLEFCTPEMIRIRTSWSREFEENEPWMVVKYDWPAVAVQTREEEDHFRLETGKLVVTLTKSPFSIQIATTDGKVLTTEQAEAPGLGCFKEQAAVTCRKALFPDEHFFGFGERMDFMDRRGKQVRLDVGRGLGRPHIIGAYNILEANYSPVPFFMSTRGYGIFLHTSYASGWDMGSKDPESFSFTADGGELDYYFIYGPGFPDILNRYTALTGRSPLLPRFALGLHVGTYSGGTWGYEEHTSTQYVVDLVRKFRALGIPLDILHLDSTWRIFGKNGGSGATTFEWRETFKNPAAMFDSLYAMNIQLVGVHVRPRFDNGNKLNLLDQAREKGYVYPEQGRPGEFVNFFDPEAVDWWWENGAMRVAGIGARFFKTDEGSAFGRKANESEKTGPTGEEVRKLHNLFPLAYAKAPYEKFAAFNHMRGMNHTREGYAGIQRYPFIFAGDWPSEWQYFGPVIKAGLNIGLSGIGYWAHCMGGFEHKADPELYIRWCQFGLLSPVAHLFGMDHPGYKEPWNYGDTALTLFRKYARFRYRLTPYLYTCAHEMAETGLPLMRALVLEYQEDPNVYDIGDQYLLGPDMMVCPVTEKGAQTRIVYLPEGTWINYWTGECHEGRQYLNVVTPLDQIPVFMRAGAIIPLQEPVDYLGDRQPSELTLKIYPAGRREFQLYEDDGKSLDYRKGISSFTGISCETNGQTIRIQVKKPEGNYPVQERSYKLEVFSEKAPRSVTAGGSVLPAREEQTGEAPGWFYQEKKKTIFIRPGSSSKKSFEVSIEY